MSIPTASDFETTQTGEPLDATDGRLRPDADLETALNTALESQRYLIAVWHLSGGRIHLYRELGGLPRADLRAAQELLGRDLMTLADQPPLPLDEAG